MSPRRTPTLEVTTETITPTMAKEYLNGNIHNRKVSPRLVTRYAEDMRAKAWRNNGEGLIFDWNGTLQSGQHRLLACIEADTPFTTLVVRGADPEAIYTVDSGRKRSTTDVLTLRGEKNVNTLASALAWVWRYRNDRMDYTGTYSTNTQLMALLDDNPGIRDSLLYGTRMKTTLHLSAGVMSAMHFLMHEVDPEDAQTFFDGIWEGANLKPGDPRLTLIRWAQRAAMKDHRPSGTNIAAVTIKAWNAYREHWEVKALAYRAGEAFPEIQ